MNRLTIVPPDITDAELLADLAAGLRSPEDVCRILIGQRDDARNFPYYVADAITGLTGSIERDAGECQDANKPRESLQTALRLMADSLKDLADTMEDRGNPSQVYAKDRLKQEAAELRKYAAGIPDDPDEFEDDDPEDGEDDDGEEQNPAVLAAELRSIRNTLRAVAPQLMDVAKLLERDRVTAAQRKLYAEGIRAEYTKLYRIVDGIKEG